MSDSRSDYLILSPQMRWLGDKALLARHGRLGRLGRLWTNATKMRQA